MGVGEWAWSGDCGLECGESMNEWPCCEAAQLKLKMSGSSFFV